VAVAALLREPVPAVLLGDAEAVQREAARQGLGLARVARLDEVGSGPTLLAPPAGDEPVELRALRFAVRACLQGRGRALVTGPIHKARLAARGFAHPGHTDFLGQLCGVRRPVMAFVGERMRVVLATVHLPLRRVPAALTPELLLHVFATTQRALTQQLGIARPRLAVCGLNPHAGDDGLLGDEERRVIAPACQLARQRLDLDLEGPMAAEAAALRTARGQAHVMVAMYHDQGLGPLKVLDFGRSVNWTLGLPMVRTSVDHGTADDIAGRGRADPGSMLAAIRLARRLSRPGPRP